jgi:hypothetical protein
MSRTRLLRRPATLIIPVLLLAGCDGGSDPAPDAASSQPTTTVPFVVEVTTTSTTATRVATTTTSPSSVSTGPTSTARPQPVTTQPGLTADESLRINPPAPRNVRVQQAVAGRVVLTWDEPPPVAVPHTYSDRVVGYRVYRRAPNGLESEPIGTTGERTFTDDTVRSGQRYAYQVSSIRERDLEGLRSDPVEAAVP